MVTATSGTAPHSTHPRGMASLGASDCLDAKKLGCHSSGSLGYGKKAIPMVYWYTNNRGNGRKWDVTYCTHL